MPKLSEDYADQIQVLKMAYSVTARQESYNEAAFGNGFLLLEGAKFELRFVRDRGQVFVDIRNVGREWVDAETLLERCNLHPRPGERLTANDILTAIGTYSLQLRSECSR